MRMTEYNLLWNKGIEELKEVDIDLEQTADVAGWCYLRGAGLTEEQRERVLATLPHEHFPTDQLSKTLVRLFPNLHPRESVRDKWPNPRESG